MSKCISYWNILSQSLYPIIFLIGNIPVRIFIKFNIFRKTRSISSPAYNVIAPLFSEISYDSYFIAYCHVSKNNLLKSDSVLKILLSPIQFWQQSVIFHGSCYTKILQEKYSSDLRRYKTIIITTKILPNEEIYLPISLDSM
jgi:hypothetical protein